MDQPPLEQSHSDQPHMKPPSGYLWELSSAAAKYLEKHPEAAEILETKAIDLSALAIFSHLKDKPHLQQRVADLVDYSPSRWLLTHDSCAGV